MSAPYVSVVIPAYHSEATIAHTLEALRRQTYRNFETIVVDSSSDEKTAQVVRERFPEVTLHRSQQRLLPHAARNAGVELAGGDLLVFTDPDCVAAPVWLELLASVSERGHTVVGGAIELEGGGWPERGIHLSKFALWVPDAPRGSRPDLATANVLWTRSAWERFGPFPGEIWCGDTEISWRARRAGVELYFEPAAVVRHAHTTGLRAFFRERRIRGEDFARMRARVERWSRLGAGVHLLAAPLVPFLLLGRSLRSAGGIRALETVPVQLLGFLGWSLGEAAAFARAVFARSEAGHQAGA